MIAITKIIAIIKVFAEFYNSNTHPSKITLKFYTRKGLYPDAYKTKWQ